MGKIDKFIINDTTYEIVPEIAPLFSATTAYSVGDCVIHDAILYKFTANHAAGAWTGNDVEAFEVGNRINKISDSVAPEFNSSASYTAGQYVYNNGVLYRFTSTHSGAWTGTDVEVVTVGGEITDLKADLDEIASGGSGLTAAMKQALLQIASKVAYIDDQGQAYYDDLYDALYAVTAIRLNTNSIQLASIGATSQLTATTVPEGGAVTWSSSDTSVATVDQTGLVTSVAYGSATITASSGSVSATCSVLIAAATCTGITAAYTQSGKVYDSDALDSLKSDLVVTASWSNGTTTTLTASDYTLSGTLATGTSTVTVSYAGQTDTFDVNVVGLVSITATYTQSGTVYDDASLDDLKADLVVTANYSDSSTTTVASADYTLSGTLTVGTSTITVAYGGKTTTFSVTVTEWQPITQTITWSGTGADQTSTVIDATQYDAYFELPFVDGATGLVEGTTSSTTAFKIYDTYLYSDLECTTQVGRYHVATGEIAQTGKSATSYAFETKLKVVPQGYYAKILLNKLPTVFDTNANFQSYLNNYAGTVTLE